MLAWLHGHAHTTGAFDYRGEGAGPRVDASGRFVWSAGHLSARLEAGDATGTFDVTRELLSFIDTTVSPASVVRLRLGARLAPVFDVLASPAVLSTHFAVDVVRSREPAVVYALRPRAPLESIDRVLVTVEHDAPTRLLVLEPSGRSHRFVLRDLAHPSTVTHLGRPAPAGATLVEG